jgi:TadE-like protein
MLIHRMVLAVRRSYRPGAERAERSLRGQSLVEFALVLPMLLVLLLGIADFGRVFSAGITLEATARNAAEAAAQEYVQLIRNRPGGVLDTDDYQHLHDIALEKVCEEAAVLPNRALSGSDCTMPVTGVCVHPPDGTADPIGCGSDAAAAPAECGSLTSGWSDGNAGYVPAGSTPLGYVEVRVCYRFTTLINLSDLRLPFGWGLSLGDIYLQRTRQFAVACYPQATGPCT